MSNLKELNKRNVREQMFKYSGAAVCKLSSDVYRNMRNRKEMLEKQMKIFWQNNHIIFASRIKA